MQYGLEKIILPSFYNPPTPTEKLTQFLNWGIKTFIPILKESDVQAAQPLIRLVKRHSLDLLKLRKFVNTYLDVYQISSKNDLMKLRDDNILSANNEQILKDVVKGYIFDHPFDALSVKSDHSDYRDATIRQIKSSYQANQIDSNDMFDKIFRGILYWAIANYQTPEMLESKRQAILLEERRKQEALRQQQEAIRQKELQQQNQIENKSDRSTPTTVPDMNWGNVLDIISNQNKNTPSQESQNPGATTTSTPSPIDLDSTTSSSPIPTEIEQETTQKPSMNTVGRGLLVLATTTIVSYGVIKLMSKDGK